MAKNSNRWIQREYKFALDLPDGWQPGPGAQRGGTPFANGPAHGVWSDNLLVLAQAHRNADLDELAKALPDQLQQEDPSCEIVSCKVVTQGKQQALETVVRTHRGPFSMTVIERRFRGDRFDYEVKYTVESKRFDELAPKLSRKPRQLPRDARRRPRRGVEEGGVDERSRETERNHDDDPRAGDSC